jgi:hypothetical protein
VRTNKLLDLNPDRESRPYKAVFKFTFTLGLADMVDFPKSIWEFTKRFLKMIQSESNIPYSSTWRPGHFLWEKKKGKWCGK